MAKKIREFLFQISKNKRNLDEKEISKVLKDGTFLEHFYSLFDVDSQTKIPQIVLSERLRNWALPNMREKKEKTERKMEFVETLEFVIYLVCSEQDITMEHFSKIFTSKGVEKLLLKFLGDDKRAVEIEVLMSFIMETTNYKEVDEERQEKIHQAFISNFGQECTAVSYEKFKKILPCKDDFFVRRLFEVKL